MNYPGDDPTVPPERSKSAPSSEESPSEREILAQIGELRDEFSQWLKQGAKLFGAESKLFASSLLWIVALAVISFFVISGALIFLISAVVLALIVHVGMDPGLAALLAAFSLLAIAGICFICIRNLTRHLRFTESRRLLARLTQTSRSDDDGEIS